MLIERLFRKIRMSRPRPLLGFQFFNRNEISLASRVARASPRRFILEIQRRQGTYLPNFKCDPLKQLHYPFSSSIIGAPQSYLNLFSITRQMQLSSSRRSIWSDLRFNFCGTYSVKGIWGRIRWLHVSSGILVAGKPERHVSTVKMLTGRESNFSCRGRFSNADSCHMLSRFLPVYGPTKVDQMRSRTFVSQFSADCSLFVAGFQRSQIRIYNVEKGWRVQKDVLAKSMKWTIIDTCLSPDQRFLVYSSMSPLAHIVNIESSPTESHANVTEIHDGLNFLVNDDDEDEFSIFSMKFSTDGRELVAGTGDNAI